MPASLPPQSHKFLHGACQKLPGSPQGHTFSCCLPLTARPACTSHKATVTAKEAAWAGHGRRVHAASLLMASFFSAAAWPPLSKSSVSQVSSFSQISPGNRHQPETGSRRRSPPRHCRRRRRKYFHAMLFLPTPSAPRVMLLLPSPPSCLREE